MMRTQILSLLLGCCAMPCTAATLRPATTLAAPVVLLSDLFDDAGAEAQRVLGPAPAPGGRIVVETQQLAAIARQFRVDWRPLSHADRAVLDRPGQPLPQAAILDAVRSALTTAGAPAACDIELPGLVMPVVASEAPAQVAITQLDYDPASSRFSGMLSVTGATMSPISMRLAGRALETVEVPVTTRRLLPGEVLHEADLKTARIRAALVRVEIAREAAQAVGMAVRHQVVPGQPVPLADLMRPAVVQKNQTVLMLLDSPGIALSAQGQALDGGALGEHIRVLNPVSRAIVDAEVIDGGRVRVSPTAIPTLQSARGTQLVAR